MIREILFSRHDAKLIRHDTPDTLAAKVHALEYEHFPEVIEELVSKAA